MRLPLQFEVLRRGRLSLLESCLGVNARDDDPDSCELVDGLHRHAHVVAERKRTDIERSGLTKPNQQLDGSNGARVVRWVNGNGVEALHADELQARIRIALSCYLFSGCVYVLPGKLWASQHAACP